MSKILEEIGKAFCQKQEKLRKEYYVFLSFLVPRASGLCWPIAFPTDLIKLVWLTNNEDRCLMCLYIYIYIYIFFFFFFPPTLPQNFVGKTNALKSLEMTDPSSAILTRLRMILAA